MKFNMVIVLTIVLVVGVGLLLILSEDTTAPNVASISTFEECKQAGYPIMESYPEQCATPDGRTFINESQVTPGSEEPVGGGANTSEPIVTNGCTVAGCSGQLCVSAEEADNAVSTCEYRAEYACYKEASCEPQTNGTCGWTQTTELKACLNNPPALDPSSQPVF